MSFLLSSDRSGGGGESVTIVDDMEDGDIAEYSGTTSPFSVQTGTVLEGSETLEGSNLAQNDHIGSKSGLAAYPSKGDVFSCLVQPGTEGVPETAFALPSGFDGPNFGYTGRVHLGYPTPKIELQKRFSGYTRLAQLDASSLSAGTTYDYEFEWHDGTGSEPDNTIVFTVYEYDTANMTRGTEVGSVSAQDSTGATNTGIGFLEGAGNSPTNYWDYYRITGSV